MHNIIEKHKKIVLLFSGGKDSMACLFLMRKFWNKINVMWINTGAAFPEIISIMDHIKILVPEFTEIKTDQNEFLTQYGYPSDILPINNTPMGRVFQKGSGSKVSSYIDCCATNIWIPSMNAVRQYGATLIIKGQKSCDDKKAPIKSGDVIDGLEHLLPVETWADADVMAYLREQDFEMPKHYYLKASSLDCWNCTAYCSEHLDKVSYMKTNHPQKYASLLGSLADVHHSIMTELSPMNAILGGKNG